MQETDRREMIGPQVGEVEPEAEWCAFCAAVARGLSGVRLAISEPGTPQRDRRGLGRAVAALQRALHRDTLGDVPATPSQSLKQIFAAPDRESPARHGHVL
jgi:hypothetical protein